MVTESIKAYHASSPVSRSQLMKIAESPEKFQYYMENKEDPTEALLLGSAVHKLVLEPEDFDKEFAVEPVVNKRTNAGRDALDAFYCANEGKIIITPKTYEQAKAMASSVLANKQAKILLCGEVEKSYYWKDDITEEDVKCRPDCVTKLAGKTLIVDLKTGTNVTTENFSKEMIKYGYDVQAAMCKDGVEREVGEECDVIYVAVEKEPPYAVNIMKTDALVIEYGKRRYREFLGIYHECKTANNWYGYLGFANEVNVLSLPAYLLKELQ